MEIKKIRFKLIIGAKYQINTNEYDYELFTSYPSESVIENSVNQFKLENKYLNVEYARVEKIYYF